MLWNRFIQHNKNGRSLYKQVLVPPLGRRESPGSTAWQHFYLQPDSTSKYYGLNLQQPLQLFHPLLCQLPALITCSWVPGFRVYIRHLTLPLLPLTVHNRQTFDIPKPAHASSFPKALQSLTPRFRRAGNAASQKGSLNLDALHAYASPTGHTYTQGSSVVLLDIC